MSRLEDKKSPKATIDSKETWYVLVCVCVCVVFFRRFTLALRRLASLSLAHAAYPHAPYVPTRTRSGGLFVTWEKKNRDGYDLRGCIGNLSDIGVLRGLDTYTVQR